MKLLGVNAGTTAVCRTVDKVDIFGDNSGKALYRLDGNANDESGNYHGTETAITYGGGQYERGAVFNGSSSKITVSAISGATTISFWTNKAITNGTAKVVASNSNDTAIFIGESFAEGTSETISMYSYTDAVTRIAYIRDVLNDTTWKHIVIQYISSGVYEIYMNGTLRTVYYGGGVIDNKINTFTQYGTYSTGAAWLDASIDQIRIFNRAITETEVATLYAECAPTSTVDDINPFMDGSLKALYQFNGDATDATGVYNGTTTDITYGTGKFGQCALFNGSSSKINATKSISNTQSVTISMLVKPDAAAYASNNMAIISYDYDHFYILFNSSGITWNSLNTNGTLAYEIVYVTARTDWFHIVAINEINGNHKLYINGVLIQSIAFPSASRYSGYTNAGLGIGVNTYNNTQFFHGSIDQVRIFNKALTPMEVASLYNETTPLEEPMSSLVDPFKDGSGKALYRLEGNALDESGNYNGTLSGGSYTTGIAGRCYSPATGGIVLPNACWNNSTSMSITTWLKTSTSVPAVVFGSYYGSMSTFESDGSNLLCGVIVGSQWVWIYLPMSNITNNAWRHLVLSAGNGVMSLYLDGVVFQSVTCGPIALNYASLNNGNRIGANYSGAVPWQGSIDQFRVFNRALTQEEVTTLYTEGA